MKKKYTIDCIGDAVQGDQVLFEKTIFTGTYPNSTFSHLETVEGKIIKESYGAEKQQHTFTLLLDDGSNMRIKGRNLYKNGCLRKEWDDEDMRNMMLDEKHDRGNEARETSSARKNEQKQREYDYATELYEEWE